jgi:hypothetical protein
MDPVVWDGRGVANDGVPYENSYAWIMRLRDGRVIDGTAFFDGLVFDELWTGCHRRSDADGRPSVAASARSASQRVGTWTDRDRPAAEAARRSDS